MGKYAKDCILKFIYSEKATKFCEISTLLLSYVVPVKRKVEISQNFVAFSEYMNFNKNRSFGTEVLCKIVCTEVLILVGIHAILALF